MNPHIVIVGGPVDGFEYYGPFPDFLAAERYAHSLNEQTDSDVLWWVTELISITN